MSERVRIRAFPPQHAATHQCVPRLPRTHTLVPCPPLHPSIQFGEKEGMVCVGGSCLLRGACGGMGMQACW
eukprot:209326-Chlamydomonas_euryale.AAC.1